MTNCVNYQPQPYPANYSGVTIQITNPTVNANPYGAVVSGGCIPNQNCQPYQQGYVQIPQYNTVPPMLPQPVQTALPAAQIQPEPQTINTPQPAATTQAAENQTVINSYPPQYYMNNYNYNTMPQGNPQQASAPDQPKDDTAAGKELKSDTPAQSSETDTQTGQSLGLAETKDNDMTSSKEIIDNLDNISAEQKELEKNGKQQRVVALTNEYIMSLENYLNNPNLDIRLMAAKEVLTRLDEDKNRYDDAALNALLNKMLQDPEELIRIAALSAFNSELASGNDYTVTLLTKIQQNPDSNKDDVLQASEILLKMSADTDVKYTPAQSSKIEIKTTTKGE